MSLQSDFIFFLLRDLFFLRTLFTLLSITLFLQYRSFIFSRVPGMLLQKYSITLVLLPLPFHFPLPSKISLFMNSNYCL